jgi:predicted metal-dependent hydrolase
MSMENLEFIFKNALYELRPRAPLPEIRIEFFPFAGLNHTARLRQNRLIIRVSDIFNDAPLEIYQSLARILLSKLYRKRIDEVHHRTYRTFILTDEIQERARAARRHRCRMTRIGVVQGRYVDLKEMFDRLNEQYFEHALTRPRLLWSAKRARHILGRFDAGTHTIFMSRFLDSLEVPAFVTEFVMFHEMLHLKHHSRVEDSRLIVHTPEFKKAEIRFAKYQEAKLWLKRI